MRLVSLLLVAIALPAVAAPPTAPPAPDPARDHYERGLAKYNLAEFDAAIVEFKQSYELSKAPRLLFNIAQAYRLKKDLQLALYFYETYLRADPSPPNLADVEDKIAEMKHALDEEQRRAPTGGPTTTRGGSATAMGTPRERAPRRRTMALGIAVGAVGVASLAVGGGLLGLASSDARSLHAVAVAGQPWTAANQAMFDQGERAQTAGIVMLSVGGALVVGGSVALVIALRGR
ncbi:MAG TPA: hypothetical protein VGL86_09200 [Polyangia bacterium]|jgi:tetratricopeptide (TPR) repeat protein